ncbi:MAG: hypothetical protein LBT06_05545, partial [Hungatella sp.]|nr:hypothetical protein [Hungatella sp.]
FYDGTPCAGKLARTVWDGGKTGDVLIIVLICQKFTYRHMQYGMQWKMPRSTELRMPDSSAMMQGSLW